MNNISQLAGLGLFDARVPRYTSYPTAPQFGDTVNDTRFASWIRQISPGSRISLYLHVPFCRRLCWFCACRTQGTSTGEPLAAYVETLKSELALLAQNLPEGVTLSRLHWGGGTPTMLSADLIRDLAAAVFDVAKLDKDGEFSIEIDPNEIDEARLDALAEAGMNRASIGVQDFDDEIQNIIGRIQSFETTQRAVTMLRERGITSLNADILFGLPNQTKGRITESVQKLLSIGPDRVALYGYAHVPWMAKRQQMIPTDALPTPQERLELFETARQLFTWDGYDEIGIDHFALPGDGLQVAQKAGKLRRNFQGYTDDNAEVLVGLGASAISRFPQGYAQNLPSTSLYTARIRDGRFATARGHVMSADDTLRARIIEALMCDFSVSLAELRDSFGPVLDPVLPVFRDVAREFGSLVSLTPSGLDILPDGRPLTRVIARRFDAYCLSKAGHSSAI